MREVVDMPLFLQRLILLEAGVMPRTELAVSIKLVHTRSGNGEMRQS